MKILAALLIPIALTGCFGKERIIYKEVRVLVPGKVEAPPALTKPYLPIHEITKDTPDDAVGAAYYETVRVLQNEVEKRDRILHTYKTASDNWKPTP